MPKYKAFLLCATMSLGLAETAQAQSSTTETAPMMEVTADIVIATVNGATITFGHLVAAAESLDQEEARLPNDVLLEGLTERLIQQAAISAVQKDLSKPTLLKLENERRALVASDVVEALAAEIDVSDEDLKAAYNARFADFTPPTEYNASHILVETEDEANALVTSLESGADFAELAKEKSTGPSGPNGGNLGWFVRGQMVDEFQDAVEALDVGTISAPIMTQFGWHVIKLNETRVPNVPDIDEMTGELQNEIFRQRLFAEIKALVDSAEVVRSDLSKIDPAALRNSNLIRQ